MVRIRSWIHKISAIHHDFHGWENIPLHVLISVVDLEVNGWRLMSDLWTRVPILMDLVHQSRDLFHRILFRKIIPLILEISRPPYFYTNTSKLFQSYIVVPIILHLGPYWSFYNYNYVPALINLIYFNYIFNLLTLNLHNFLTVAPIQAILELTRL
jgi:hypothetical protein